MSSSVSYLGIIFFFEFTEEFHKSCSCLFHTWLTIDIVHLSRVLPEIVEFPLIDVIIEMYQTVSLVPHSVMTLYCMFCRVFVEMIVEAFSPMFYYLFVFFVCEDLMSGIRETP